MLESTLNKFIDGLKQLDLYVHDENFKKHVDALQIDLQNDKQLTQEKLAAEMVATFAKFPEISRDFHNQGLKKTYKRVHLSEVTLQPNIMEKLRSNQEASILPLEDPSSSFTTKK